MKFVVFLAACAFVVVGKFQTKFDEVNFLKILNQ